MAEMRKQSFQSVAHLLLQAIGSNTVDQFRQQLPTLYDTWSDRLFNLGRFRGLDMFTLLEHTVVHEVRTRLWAAWLEQ